MFLSRSVVLIAFLTGCTAVGQSSVLQELNGKIASLLVRKEVPSYEPPLGWRKIEGLYPSWIHLYAHGNPLVAKFRNWVKIYDNNAFATAWITTQLVEGAVYGGFRGVDENQLLLALKGISRFSDKNRATGTSIVTFWEQQFNETAGLWSCSNENMLGAIDYAKKKMPWSKLSWLLKHLGLENVNEQLERLLYLFDIFPHIFKLPADFDDSTVNLGLGLLLEDSPFVRASTSWQKNNANPSALMDFIKIYAYRPFGKNNETNIIDPRTYFYARKFLEKADRQFPLSLVGTWAQNLTENVKQRPSVATPLNVNNVDCTVAANTIYAITAALIKDLGKKTWFDNDLKSIYLNTTDFIVWAINNKTIEKRPDLALTYYPSQYNFHWFMSRILFLIRSQPQVNIPEITLVKEKLLEARNMATDWLLRKAETEKGSVYFDDFLGNGDTDIFGRLKKRGDARISSTGMALNAIIGYWSTFNYTNKHIHWDKDMPKSLKLKALKAVQWLANQILKDDLEKMNLFFSGSAKGNSSNPSSYPMNYIYYVNGTKPQPNFDLFALVLGWQGVVSESTYQKWIQIWNTKTPYHVYEKFPGYNSADTLLWPFWSSPAFTYSTAFLALAQYANTVD